MFAPTLAIVEPANINVSQRAINWSAPLTGPWKFRLGDDPRWASPQCNDAAWSQLDLTPAPGARDPDVGLSGYVPGWAANGYKGYSGYAWYRVRISGLSSRNDRLALVGPVLVDNAYQVFLNGALLGGIGNFSKNPPAAYGIRPTIFLIPETLTQGRSDLLVAVRVWMGPWMLAGAAAGGMHIAPVLGNVAGARAVYQVQWLERIRGELPELVPMVLFIGLAIMAFVLSLSEREKSGLRWIALSLVLLTLVRGNLVVFWCTQAESIQTFELVSIVLLAPLTLGAWIVTWYRWLLAGAFPRIALIIGALTSLYIVCAFLMRSWFHGILPSWLVSAARVTIVWDRRALFVILVLIVYRAFRTRPREAAIALPAIVLIAIGQFASELFALGVPGIWFPFDMGVSLANYAYALAPIAIFALLVSSVPSRRTEALASP
ncbi:MAG: hypothetical protein WA431_04260 [Candidatus Cybelea sp.]